MGSGGRGGEKEARSQNRGAWPSQGMLLQIIAGWDGEKSSRRPVAVRGCGLGQEAAAAAGRVMGRDEVEREQKSRERVDIIEPIDRVPSMTLEREASKHPGHIDRE